MVNQRSDGQPSVSFVEVVQLSSPKKYQIALFIFGTTLSRINI